MKLKTRKFNNKKLSNLIRSATRFYIESIIPKQFIPHLKIEIECLDIENDGTVEKIGTNNYLIELCNNISFEHMLVTLAHEVVHIKQYILKELKTHYIYGKPVDVWKGKRYRNLKYLDQPWEKEALQKEVELYQWFIGECYASGNINKLVNMRHLTC